MKFQTSLFSAIFVALLLLPAWAQDPSSWGQASEEFVLTGAKIIVSPGQVINRGKLHIKNGRIVAVGAEIPMPSDIRTIDMSDSVIHAGFIDPYVVGSRVGLDSKDKDRATPVSGSHPRLHDDFKIADVLDLKKDALGTFRKEGFTLVSIAPEGGIFRGQGALYRTGDSELDSDLLVRAQSYSVLGFMPLGWEKLDKNTYPLSLMGGVALIRQTFLDTNWYVRARENPDPTRHEPSYDGNLESLQGVTGGTRRLVVESKNYLETLRMLVLLGELKLPKSAVLLSGEEWKNLNWFKEVARNTNDYVLPLKFPTEPKKSPGTGVDQFSLDLLQKCFYAPANARWLTEMGTRYSFTSHGVEDLEKFRKGVLETVEAGLSKDQALAALTTEPARVLDVSTQYGTLEKGKSASFVVRNEEPFSASSKVKEVWIDGKRYPDYSSWADETDAKDKSDKPKTREFVKSSSYDKPPLMFPTVFAPDSVLVKNATLWTQKGDTPPSVGDLLVVNGRISQVGTSLSPPPGAQVIDGQGLHVTPGLVDAHSHTAVDGMVNEPGANITAMVRMKDVIDPFDHDIYLQLASGVTAVNILHGSANAIGGQSVTCKWKFGSSPQDLVMSGAPGGIKFALGENPKKSNFSEKHASNYPQSRMGVVQLIHGAFESAKNYRKLKLSGQNPRPDLVLEALLEVLDGQRIVHCHSYRQDEILALIQVADQVGFKVNVFQHVLEGYKVATEIAEHGASASTFADWWAYKVEVEDAIPHNASLMAEAGVLVSINSDSDDLARRLNTEAAKSIRYGGMSELAAMDLITRNPAQQLGVLNRIGTLEPGKDGDFVLWDGPPLTQNAKVLETWIEGKRYFQASSEQQRVARHDAERRKLLEILVETEEKKS